MRKLIPLALAAFLLVSCASDDAGPRLPAPGDAQGYMERGKSLSAEGNHLGAVDSFSAAIELEPQNADAHFLRGQAHYGYVCQLLEPLTGETAPSAANMPPEAVQHLEQAVADYTSAIELDPQNPKAYNNRANAYASLGQYQSALDDYDSALQFDSTSALAYFNRGLLRYWTGDYDQAIVDLERYLELVPDAEDRTEVASLIQELRAASPPAP